jgi:hypothetical protein
MRVVQLPSLEAEAQRHVVRGDVAIARHARALSAAAGRGRRECRAACTVAPTPCGGPRR